MIFNADELNIYVVFNKKIPALRPGRDRTSTQRRGLEVYAALPGKTRNNEKKSEIER